MVICLERGIDLHMAQLIPLPLTVSCFSKIQIGFTLLVLAHRGSPGQRAIKRVCVCPIAGRLVFSFISCYLLLTMHLLLLSRKNGKSVKKQNSAFGKKGKYCVNIGNYYDHGIIVS